MLVTIVLLYFFSFFFLSFFLAFLFLLQMSLFALPNYKLRNSYLIMKILVRVIFLTFHVYYSFFIILSDLQAVLPTEHGQSTKLF